MRPDIDLRAALNTRGALITYTISLLALVGAGVLGGVLQALVVEPAIVDVEMTFIVITLPLSLIIPVVTVLMIAGEWSDRSIQTTFLQRPGRLGVLGSKILANIVVVGALLALSVGLAALGTWIGGMVGDGASFESFRDVLTTQMAMMGATWLMSLAMAVLAQSAVVGMLLAIGLPFVISTFATIAMATGSEVLDKVARAVHLQDAAYRLIDGTAGAFELLPLTLMVLIPLALGARRWSRREIG